MTGLSTHVLDLANGEPAASVAVRLSRKGEMGTYILCAATLTDQDGRAKLLGPGEGRGGAMRLEFDIGDYFRAKSPQLAGDFLDTVVIDFVVCDPSVRHHVPLLVSPFGYSTYKGS